jgi:hypothetical protein
MCASCSFTEVIYEPNSQYVKERMALDTSLLFGEMAGSALLHLFFPLLVSVLYMGFPTMTMNARIWMMIGLVAAMSFAAQFVFLAQLQAASCNGVKDYKSILKGAFIATLISAAMVAVPMFVESMRLIASQLIGDHKVLLTPALAKANAIITNAAMQMSSMQSGGGLAEEIGALTPEEYETQTLKEMSYGAAYWSAFAGAYGVGVGSLFAAKCPATD